ncbi:MAG: alpha/beta hydrolase [Hyphomicrobiaceae bacterium]|nr:alpha/beta hydrolase [Hyphomicrobiaceae bacterium]
MASFDHRGLRAQYRVCGQGVPVVLLHAGGSSARQWAEFRNHCPDTYQYLAPDLIGFGQTDIWPGPGDLTHDHQGGLVSALVREVFNRPVHLVGHSYGGSTAVRLALSHPDQVESLTLIEPNIVSLLQSAGEREIFDEYLRGAKAFMDSATAGDLEKAWAEFVDMRNGPGAWRDTPDRVRTRMFERTQQMIDGFMSNLNNTTTLADCRTLDLPVMVVCGEKTTRPERRITEMLAETLPHCRYEVIAGAGHMSPLTHPAEVAALVVDHLTGLENRQRRSA